MPKIAQFREIVMQILEALKKEYWGVIRAEVQSNPKLQEITPGFLLDPRAITIYIGRTHLGLEYEGSEILERWPVPNKEVPITPIVYIDSGQSFIDQITGMYFDDSCYRLQYSGVIEDLVLPTDAGFDELVRQGWNFSGESMVMGINSGGIEAMPGQFTRIVNGRFFDCDESGLRTRHVKWLDLFPVSFDDSNPEFDALGFDLSPLQELAKIDARNPYPLPREYRAEKLPKLNRLVELIGNKSTKETEITRFIAKADFNFILTMRFGADYTDLKLLTYDDVIDGVVVQFYK